MGLRKTIFGRSKYKPNTFIGGVSDTINSPALIAGRLGVSESRIKSFRIKDSNIEFAVVGEYNLPTSSFSGVTTLTYFDDSIGLIKTINDKSFINCSLLSWINFPNVTTIISDQTVVGNGTFTNCTSLTSVNFPKWVHDATPKHSIFRGCSSLTSVDAPLYNGVIGSNMFQNCSVLTSINLSITGPIGINAFVGTKITTVDLTNATSIGSSAFLNVATLTGNISATSVTSIATQVFQGTGITGFDAPNCTSIGRAAFRLCTNLTSFNFPNVTTITSSSNNGDGTFTSCTSLTSASFPNLLSDATDKGYLFYNCTSLVSVSMPLYYGLVGGNMYRGCTSLTSVTMNIVGIVGVNAFLDTKITTVDLTNATTISQSAFLNVATLTGNISATSVTNIGTQAFQGTGITGITAPNCTSINFGAFYLCTSLTTVVFTNLTSINNNNSSTTGAFSFCSALTNISLPSLITVSGGWLFYNCSSLNEISMPVIVTLDESQNYNATFLGVKSGVTIIVPISMQTINSGAPHADLTWAISNISATINYV